MQVQTKSRYFQSFGGLNFMQQDYKRLGIAQLVAKNLGNRNPKAVYQYSDILKSLHFNFSIGGDVLDDLNSLKTQLLDHPELRICSPDTVEYAFAGLCQPTLKHSTSKGVEHYINEHDGFNTLLIDLCVQGSVLNKKDKYTLDYDGHIVENTKSDSAFTYKKSEGYYPVIASINKLPVYMQNRKGNTPESYNQLPIISQSIAQCASRGIQVKKFRADACCYEQKTIAFLESESIQYYIRAEMNAGLRIALEDEPQWQRVMLHNYRNIEVCSIEEPLFGGATYRRIVAYRYKVEGQLTIDDAKGSGYRYYAVVTNDKEATPKDCIEFYNQRGCEGEHHFKELDNDFGWAKLPFDNLEMNTIYMYSGIVAYLMFNILKQLYARKLSFIKPQMRLKNFILHFVTLTAKWITTARQKVLQLFTKKDYSPLYAP